MESVAGTKIFLAEVTDQYNPSLDGVFYAKIFIDGHPKENEPVNYCSPFVTNTEGGFVAMPTPGTQILVCQPEGQVTYYYLGSTFAPILREATGGTKIKGNAFSDASKYPFERADPDMFRARGVPKKSMLKGARGGGLVISEEDNPTFINTKIELNSPNGKTVTLDDSPGIDSITLDSGNNSKITIANQHMAGLATPSLFAPSMSEIRVESSGDQTFKSVQGTVNMRLQDGKEVNIMNNSTGDHKPLGFPPIMFFPPLLFSNAEYGNINIQSKFKDVNIFTDTSKQDNFNAARGHGTGRIFLDCLNTKGTQQVIQLQTRGTGSIPNPPVIRGPNITNYGTGGCVIRLKSSGKIEIEAIGDVEIVAKGGNLNMRAEGDLNLSAGGSINAVSNVASPGGINMIGLPINLNPIDPTPISTWIPGSNIFAIGSDYPVYGTGGVM